MHFSSVFIDIANDVLGIIVTFDKNGKIVMLNRSAEEELGYREGEEVYVWDIFRPIFHKPTDLAEFIEQNRNHQIESVIYRKNKTCFPVELRFGQVNISNDLYVCAVTNIVTKVELTKELMRAEQDAKEALKVRNEFVANITHELRTPVNGIKGHVKYLMEQENRESESLRALQIIDKCCDNMSEIINNLLDFSKMSAGKLELEEKEFKLRECLSYIIDANIKIANEKGISLTLRVAENIPDNVAGDELRLTQILNNLISNAIKFTSIGYVRVEVVQILHIGYEMELFFVVIDSGIGIAPEDKEKLFESFTQVDGSITRKYGGTGLGLSISKKLVQMMRGNINCESEPGKGSTFSFSIFLHTKEKAFEKNQLKKTKRITNELDNLNAIYQYGTQENKTELNGNMEKLIICVEMKTWQRAEEFAKNVRKLLETALNPEFKKKAFKLEMAVRKEEYEKSTQLFKELKELLKSQK